MAIHTIDLLHPVFSQTFMGYASSEVDEFLKEIAEAISSLSADKMNLTHKIAELESRLKDCETEKQKALKALSDQGDWSDEKIMAVKRRIRQEATSIIKEATAKATAKAENIVQQGNMRLARIMSEITEAESFKKQLEEQLNTMQGDILAWFYKSKAVPANKAKKSRIAGQVMKKALSETGLSPENAVVSNA
ncbi:MAG: DivIVA domain-containing protein [Deltaproteobacteria bacterium]|jgi:cell division initiation protein|nr:DivIVA domain-containing protein [Deltaproteobacteria bacterium]